MSRIDDILNNIEPLTETLFCKRCFKHKNSNAFPDQHPLRFRNICLDCVDSLRNHQNTIAKKYRYKTKYNLSVEAVNAIIQTQNYKCAICQDYINEATRPHVDHCHSTGKIRGILCFNCNVGLGYFKDKIKVLQQAIKYLHLHGED